ncbi:TerD family protein [Hazenella sp. IB182353]|uniref:TerD family protein n=1 Tax=Polycladospora coralii TaxID=2771432 RepID=UPI00174748A3|nr:TerD family protein [Polycladospora coralii]MBS7531396.1 TerD family protein [Polycladospora coralii]
MKNTIYLRRKNKVIVALGNDSLPIPYVATMMKNIESLGYTVSISLMKRLLRLSIPDFIRFQTQLITDLRHIVGADKEYNPMYPNFPQQLMHIDESQLYLNAIEYYLTQIPPDTKPKEKRLPLIDQVNLTVIECGEDDEFIQMIKDLICANTSISKTDQSDIAWALTHFPDCSMLLPQHIPMRENMSFVLGVLYTSSKASSQLLSNYVKSPTDILRFATQLSDGDISLATNTKFKKFSRSDRRLLLGLLEICKVDLSAEMITYRKQWIRLGEILHPMEYQKRFPKASKAFSIIRNQSSYPTFNSEIELAIRTKNKEKILELLSKKPGEFARRLDHILRIFPDDDMILEKFREIATQVATPLLLQVCTHFKHRDKPSKYRTFFPKGIVGKIKVIPHRLSLISSSTCVTVVQICESALCNRFASLPSLGKVYVSKDLIDYTVPFSQRSANKSVHTVARGSRISIPEGNTIRFFTWWREGEVNNMPTGRVDLDLSVVMYDTNWHYMEHISYTHLRSHDYRSYHSGDITEAPNGACEFIDLDMPSIQRYGGRYIVMSLHIYTSQSFDALPECFAGWMIRKHPKSGEIFEPSTIQNKLDLTGDAHISIPVILDLQDRKVIWTDLTLRFNPDSYNNNIEENQTGIVAIGKGMSTMAKPTLYDLFRLHAAARGNLVEDEQIADTVFSLDGDYTPYDIEAIISKFLMTT